MIDFWAPLALATSTAALLAIPVTPALYELWKRKDAGPLPTSRHDGAIDNFADTLRAEVAAIRPELDACRNRRECSRVRLQGMNVLIVGEKYFAFSDSQVQDVALIACSCDTTVPVGALIKADVYSDGNLNLECGAVARAAVARGDVTLGEQSTVLRWLSANGDVYLRENSTAYGRVSGASIHISAGCGFQRLFARTILTLDASGPAFVQSSNPKPNPAELHEAASGTHLARRQRTRADGDFSLPPNEALEANLIVTGSLRLGRNSGFCGSAKSYKDAVFEEGVTVRGSFVCSRSLHIGPNCFVAGPIMAEDEVIIERGCRIGAPDSPTTVSARRIRIAPGCQLHGTVWARVQGSIES